jgi:hypothetical protein
MRSILRKPKTVAEQKCTKGASPTAFLCSPSRFSGEAFTVLLYAVLPFSNIFYAIN